MKTEITTSNKDNVAISTILVVVALLFLAGGLFTGNRAVANQVAAVGVQKLETIVVTAPRAPDTTFETIVVTASRKSPHA